MKNQKTYNASDALQEPAAKPEGPLCRLARVLTSVLLSFAMVGTSLWLFYNHLVAGSSGCDYGGLVALFYGVWAAIAFFFIAIPIIYRLLDHAAARTT